jgi:phosphatidylglycerol:prolipoprotein diacylglycerol transferase
MYVVGYFLGFQIMKWRARMGLFKVSYRACESYITYLIIGMLLGARLMYVFVYNWDTYSQHPMDIFKVWQGGLSFHGAAIGMAVASYFFARAQKIPLYSVLDTMAFCAAPGLFFGRIGNFMNAELYGRPSHLPWAMIFPTDPDKIPRHPSQLYEALLEGLVLATSLYLLQKFLLKKHRYRHGLIGGAFLIGYGILRFLVEFTREPDRQLGFVLGPLSMGQVLSILTLVAGLLIWLHARYTMPIYEPKASSEEFLQS